MFELITQILLLVGLYYLIRAIWPNIYNAKFFAWFGVAVLISLIVLAFIHPTNQTIGILWAILSFPLRPLGLTLTLLAFAMGEGWRKAKGDQILAAFLILLISSLPVTAYLLTIQTEQRSVIEAIRRQEAANPCGVQSIVVLGDGAFRLDPTARIRSQMSRPEDGISITLQSRLLYAAELYANRTRCDGSLTVIVSIGPQPLDSRGKPRTGEEQGVINVLTTHGVPQSQIILDKIGVDPRSSAIAIRQLLDPTSGRPDCQLFEVCDDGIRALPNTLTGRRIPIVLVTPAIMIRRASSTFSHLAFSVTPRPTEFYSFQIQSGWDLAAVTDLLPSAEALVITSRVVNEYLTTIYYFLRGWLSDPLGI